MTPEKVEQIRCPYVGGRAGAAARSSTKAALSALLQLRRAGSVKEQ